MKEIFTLNLGFSGNFSSAYFWQIQDMYIKPWDFHQPFFVQTSEGYFPRMLGVDKKESLSFPVKLSKEESEVLWAGQITKIDQDQDRDEKWTDLLSGMISRKNILPVYRDFSPSEELEDQIRYFAETSDRLQGIHTFFDTEFCDTLLTGLEVLSDFYPKSINLIFGFDFKYTVNEKVFIWKLSDFSNALLIPCPEASDKTAFSEIATGVDVMSYSYRTSEDLNYYTQKFLRYSQGNTCEFSVNLNSFSKAGVVYTDQPFIRGEEDPVILPESFPIRPCGQYMSKLFQSSYIEDFYSQYISKKVGTLTDEQESNNYILSLISLYNDLDFLE